MCSNVTVNGKLTKSLKFAIFSRKSFVTSKQFNTLAPEVFLDFSPLEIREPRSLSLFLSCRFMAPLISSGEKSRKISGTRADS